jgi:hypothetical protein
MNPDEEGQFTPAFVGDVPPTEFDMSDAIEEEDPTEDLDEDDEENFEPDYELAYGIGGEVKKLGRPEVDVAADEMNPYVPKNEDSLFRP